MAAPAILSQGTVVSIDNAAGTPVTIAGVQSISGIGSGTATKIDVTTLASTAKEYRMGLQDWGDLTLNFVWNADDAGQAAMLDAKDDQAARTFIITVPSTDPVVTLDVFTAEVLVLQMQFDIASDGVLQGTATLAVTGEPVLS